MNPLKTLIEYFKSAYAEAFKVSWPSKQDTIRYSSLVIGISIFVALAFSAIDFGFTSLFKATLIPLAEANRAAQQTAQQKNTATSTTPEPVKPTLDIDAVSGTKK